MSLSPIFNTQWQSDEQLKILSENFAQAQPYKHLYIDNFLTEDFANSLYTHFPPLEQLSVHYNGLNEQKSEGSNFDAFDLSFAKLREALNTEEFRNMLEKVTGVKDLFSTMDSLGSGIHQGKNGSYLDVHIDFNIHHVRNIHRRLNVLVFLNKNWKEEYGGYVEMWNPDVTKLVQAYIPSFNRCIIFETNEISYHGYSTIHVPEGETRKSFYAYFYTQINDYKGKYHDTVFKARPEEGLAKKIKTDVKETIKNNAKRVLKALGIKY